MKECKNCGHILEDDMLFCQKCGTRYEDIDIVEEFDNDNIQNNESEEIIEVEEGNEEFIEIDSDEIIPVIKDVSYSLNNSQSSYKDRIRNLDKGLVCKIVFGVVAFFQIVFAVDLYESYSYVTGTGALIGALGSIMLIFSLHSKYELIDKSIYVLLASNLLLLIGLSISAVQISAVGYIVVYLFAILPDIVFWFALLKKINNTGLKFFEQFEFLYYTLPFVKPIIFMCGIASSYVWLAYIIGAGAAGLLAFIVNKGIIVFQDNIGYSFKNINKKYIVLGAVITVIIALIIIFAIPEKDYSHIEGNYQVYRLTDEDGATYYEDDIDDYLYLDIEYDGAIEFDYYDSYDDESDTQYGKIKAEVDYSKITAEGLDDYDWEDADYYYRIKFEDGLTGYLAFFADETEFMLYYYGVEYKILDIGDSLFDDYDYSPSYSYDSYDDDDSAGYDSDDPYYQKHDYDNDGELTVDEWQDAMGEAIEDMYNGTYEGY